MELSEDVRNYLTASPTPLTNIFFHNLPDSITLGAVVVDSPGRTFPWSIQSGIQIYVRGLVRSTTHAFAVSIYKKLQGQSYFLDNFIITSCYAQSDILPMGADEKGRFQYSLNFILTRKTW